MIVLNLHPLLQLSYPSLNDAADTATVEMSDQPTEVPDDIGNNEAIATQVQAVPEFITVHCVATFENCPDDQLNQEYADSLMRYMRSEPHLEQNLVNADMKHLSGRSFRNSTHSRSDCSSQMFQALGKPASYVRKFLGQPNLWERSNGTMIKLSRIHQK